MFRVQFSGSETWASALKALKILSTYIVENTVSIVGITITTRFRVGIPQYTAHIGASTLSANIIAQVTAYSVSTVH